MYTNILFIDDFSKALVIVSDKIGNDWSRLVAYLDTELEIEVIRIQNPYNVFEQGRKALKMWSQKHPADAKVSNLKWGLNIIGRNDIIVAIENFQQ